MRTLGRLLLMALVVAATWLTLPELQRLRPPEPVARRPLPPELLERARTTPAVALRPGDWVLSPLEHQGSLEPKLLSHGELEPGALRSPDRSWSYTLRLEWLDEDGGTVLRTDYHARARLNLYRWRDRILTRAFYAYREEVPSNAAVIRFRDPRLDAARRLRVTLLELDPGLRAVALRFYLKERLPEYKRAHRWQRLSPAFRSRMVKGNVYGPEYLTDRERDAYVRLRWQPVGPERVPRGGARLLYLLDRAELERVLPAPTPADALPITPPQRGVVPVPGAGRLRLEFLHRHAPPPDARVTVRWYGKRDADLRIWTLPLEGGELPVPAAGFVEVDSPVALHLRALWNGSEDITPRPRYSRMIRLREGAAVHYPLAPLEQTRRVLRLSCRRLLPAGAVASPAAAPGPLRLTVEDDAGRVLVRQELACRGPASLYDRPARPWDETFALGEVDRLHLLLPRAARSIRLSGPDDLLAAVHLRPAGLAHLTRVPEDYAPRPPDDGRRLIWFPLQPEALEELVRQGRRVGIHLQPQPDRDQTGARPWAALEPVEAVPAWQVPVPITDPGTAPPSGYTPVQPARPLSLSLAGEPPLPAVSPRLLFAARPPQGARVAVKADGETLWSGWITARQGIVRLPPLPAGRHRFELSAIPPDGRWYLGPAEGAEAALRLRTVYTLDGDGLTFRYHKTTDQARLALRLFLPRGHEDPLRLELRISGPPRPPGTASRGWTLTHREFLVSLPEDHELLPLLPSDGQTVRMSSAVIVPLLDDLAPGTYRIHLRLGSAGRVYVSAAATPRQEPDARVRVLRLPASPQEAP